MRVKAGGNANGPVTPTPPVFFVKADSKGVASAFGVKAVDKGLTGAFFLRFLLSWKKKDGAGTAYPVGVFGTQTPCLAQRVRNSIAGKELACLGGAGKVAWRANITQIIR